MVLANLKGTTSKERNAKDVICLVVQNDVRSQFSAMTVIVPLNDITQNKN